MASILTRVSKCDFTCFIWVNPPPGPEDEVLLGVQNGMGNTKVEIIGGSSADNDVTGKFKMVFCYKNCSDLL